MTYSHTQTGRTESSSLLSVPAVRWFGLFVVVLAKGADLVATLLGLESGAVAVNPAVGYVSYLGQLTSFVMMTIVFLIAIVLIVEVAARAVEILTWGSSPGLVMLMYALGYWIPAALWSAAALYNTGLVGGVIL